MTSYTPEYLAQFEKENMVFLHPKLDLEDRRRVIYISLMYGQRMGITTEHTLIDCARFWWYDEWQYEISPTYF